MAAAAQHLDFGGDYLNVAGGQLGVFAVPLPDCASDLDHRLLIQLLDGLDGILRLQHNLGGAIEIPQDQEGQALTDLPQVFHPARQGHFLACLLHAQLAAGVGAVKGGCVTHKINSYLYYCF